MARKEFAILIKNLDPYRTYLLITWQLDLAILIILKVKKMHVSKLDFNICDIK